MAVASPSLIQRIDALAAALGTDVKSALAMISTLQTETGDVTQLNTTAKNSLVAALNELKAQVGGINLATLINDNATSLDHTWSSNKITAAINSSISALVGGAPEALNTLKELADQLSADGTGLAALLAVQAKSVRVDIAQAFTLTEQAQGRSNIGAAAAADLNDLTLSTGNIVSANFVATYLAAKA
jgi:hypothetical protein